MAERKVAWMVASQVVQTAALSVPYLVVSMVALMVVVLENETVYRLVELMED